MYDTNGNLLNQISEISEPYKMLKSYFSCF